MKKKIEVLTGSEKEGVGKDSEEGEDGTGDRARDKEAERGKEEGIKSRTKDKGPRELRQDGSRGKKHKAV